MRILIVDDNFIMRLGVRQLLQGAWPQAQLDEAESLEDAMRSVEASPVQLVILDLSLPDASGADGPTRMLRVVRGAPILVLSLNAELGYATRLMQLGVAGYLTKGRASENLVTAARTLLDGGRYVDPDMTD